MGVDNRFARLLEPGQIGPVKTRNRIIKTANGTSFIEPTGFVSKKIKAYYETLAKGGVGLLIVESCGVEYPLGVQHPPVQLRLDEDKYIPGYRELTEVVHKHSCPVFIQFQHAGPWNPTGLLPKRDSKAASALTREELPGEAFIPPRALSYAEVKEYIDIWASAAERAKKAGFDGVEINGASCHQINTFFSPIWNKRDDEYGPQTLENRSRFMCDIIREIKKRVRKDFAVTGLYNVAEYGNAKGTSFEEGIQFAKYLQAAGADAIQCRAWSYGHRNGLLHPDRIFYPEPPDNLPKDLDWSRKGKGAFIPLTTAVKKIVTIPVFCAGRLDPIMGEKFIEQGKLDFVGMTRRLLADPELPNKVAESRIKDIRPCIGCLHCIDIRQKNLPLECSVNATLGRESELVFRKAEKKKRVMVIGGGPAGMEAARLAALRGHEVRLYEQAPHLGGLVPLAAMVKDLQLQDMMAFLRYLQDQDLKAGVTIKTNQLVDAVLIEAYKPDALIIAAGPVHTPFNIPGSQRVNVKTGAAFHKQLKFYLKFLGPQTLEKLTKIWMPIGKRVVIIGGAIHGCELAEFLIKRKRLVTIVHTDESLADGILIEDQLRLFPWFDKKKVARYTGVQYKEINDQGLVIITREGDTKALPADTFIVTLPMSPNLEILQKFDGKAAEVYNIGSSANPGLIVNAVSDGARVGYSI